jgi:hypothetical protein
MPDVGTNDDAAGASHDFGLHQTGAERDPSIQHASVHVAAREHRDPHVGFTSSNKL